MQRYVSCKSLWILSPNSPKSIVAWVSLPMGLLTLILLAGCSANVPMISATNAIHLGGRVHGGREPITGSSIQLYAAGTTGDGSAATPLISQNVVTDSSGNFDISGLYKCPAPDSIVYIVARGGNPGLAVGTNNASIGLLAALGPCGALTDSSFISINEVSTVASLWPLAPYAKTGAQVGFADQSVYAGVSHEINSLANLATGTAPGPLLDASEIAPVAKLYTLASILSGCIDSIGGTAGDGTPCGQLFSYAASGSSSPPSDTIAASIALAHDPTRNVANIYSLLVPTSPFQPTLASAPSDWTLPITTMPATPVLSPNSGVYTIGQAASMAEATPGASIHYTTDGSAPTASSTLYSGPFTLTHSVTLKAVAVTDAVAIDATLVSPVASATYTIENPVSVTLAPGSVTLAASQSQQFVAEVTGTANTAVVWSITPIVGSISAAGVYTAPPSIASPQTVTVTAASVADPARTATATVLLTPPSPAYLTYYVDQVQGSDANDGISPATPFATVAKINSLTLKPGQTVAFKCGEEWHEALFVRQSGLPAAPISYTSYGTGSQPIISAADDRSGVWKQKTATIWFSPQTTDPKLINFQGQAGTPVASIGAITASTQYFWDGSALYVYSIVDPAPVVEVPQRSHAMSSAGASYITVSGLEFRGAQSDDVYCGTSLPCVSWDFENNIFDSAYGVGLRWSLNNGVSGAGLIVNHNTFRGTGSSGIGVANGGFAMGDVITNNAMTDLCKIYAEGSSENAYCDAINIFSQTETDGGGKIWGNTISNVGLTSGAPYGGGIHPDTVLNWDIEHNSIFDTNYPGIELEKGSGSIARYNMLLNTGQYTYFAGLFIRAGDGLSVSNMVAEYNTVVGGYWACALGNSQNSGAVTATGITMGQNICTGSSSGTQLWLDPGYLNTGNNFTDNGFGVAVQNFVHAGSTTYGNYTLLPPPIVGSISGDPQFVNPGAGDFSLQSTSPDLAIGAFP